MPVARHQFVVGQEVHVPPAYENLWPERARVPGSTFIVEAVPGGQRKRYALRHKQGRIRISASPEHLTGGPNPAEAGVSLVPIEPILNNGTVVEYSNGAQPGLWVVTGYTGRGHQVYPLGGADTGRKNVSGLLLQVVTLDLGDES